MSATQTEQRGTTSRRIPFKALLWGLAALVVVALAIDTTYKSEKDAKVAASGGKEAFSAATYGQENLPKVVGALEKDAVELTTLIPALNKDADAAGKQYGRRQGTSPYNFSVTFTGTAGQAESGLLPVDVDGVKGTKVQVQIGPAISGTALRDASGLIEFDQFTNQVDYADAGTALNNQMKKDVLAKVDTASLEGKKITVLGAFALLVPSQITVTPAKLEVAG